MLSYVFNPILGPDEPLDRHSPILGEQIDARNASAKNNISRGTKFCDRRHLPAVDSLARDHEQSALRPEADSRLKNENRTTVAALYQRRLFVESAQYRQL